MLFVLPSSLDSAEEVCGDYTRERLEAMDAAFVAAVELAFAKGGGRAARRLVRLFGLGTGTASSTQRLLLKKLGVIYVPTWTPALMFRLWRLWRGCELVHPELLLSACARGLGGGSFLGLKKCDDQLGRACEASARGGVGGWPAVFRSLGLLSASKTERILQRDLRFTRRPRLLRKG